MTWGAEIHGATVTPVRRVPGHAPVEVDGFLERITEVRPLTTDVGGVLVIEKRRRLFSRVFGLGA